MTTAQIVQTLDSAMLDVATTFAREAGITDPRCPHAPDLLSALRAPVSLASAYDDLCKSLGMTTPAFVRAALGGDR